MEKKEEKVDKPQNLELSSNRIRKEQILNLNLKNLPEDFTYFDLEILISEFKEYVVFINFPFKKYKKKHVRYCFVLMNNAEKAAEFYEKWNEKVVLNIFGDPQKLEFKKGNLSPEEILLRMFNFDYMDKEVIFV